MITRLRSATLVLAALAPAWCAAQISLQRIDANGNGLLEPQEVPSTMRALVDRAARRAGLDPRKPISISKLNRHRSESVKSPRDNSEKSEQRRNGRDRNRDRRSSRDENRDRGRERRNSWVSKGPSADDHGVPGFGEEIDLPLVPGFGEEIDLPLVPGFGEAFDGQVVVVSLEEKYVPELLRYVDGILNRYDTNKNRILDAGEWKAVRWRSDPHASDKNGDGRLTRSELAVRIAGFWGEKAYRRSGDKKGSDNASSREKSKTGKRSSSDKYARYAASLMRQYDKNRSGVLEKDEASQLRGYLAGSDRNGDGKVTASELKSRLSSYGQRGKRGGGDTSRSSKHKKSRHVSKSRSHRSSGYRSRSPIERQSDDLPKWFARCDANADGQVAMSEYASEWTDEKIAEFKGYDLNGDGLITAKECLQAKSDP
jgi:Ca2+-binding EF-hand superfamily protein